MTYTALCSSNMLYYTHPDSKTICDKKSIGLCLHVYQILNGIDGTNDTSTCYPNYDSKTDIAKGS